MTNADMLRQFSNEDVTNEVFAALGQASAGLQGVSAEDDGITRRIWDMSIDVFDSVDDGCDTFSDLSAKQATLIVARRVANVLELILDPQWWHTSSEFPS